MKKLLKKIKWSDLRILMMLGVLLFLYSFSNDRSTHRNLKGVDIIFKGEETHFVTSSDVKEIVANKSGNITAQDRTTVDLNNLEKGVLQNKLIKDAEVYVTIDGVLKVEVNQKKAIGRVVGEAESYYLDEDGSRMPLSDNYAERVLVVEGSVKSETQGELKQMLDVINADEFLKQEITGISIQPGEVIYLKSRVNTFEILFGSFNEMDRKLMNYKAFMQYAINEKIDIDSYKRINLKFTQQVVCSK
ncbi:cell division protein FtsQ [Myroides sp. 1354]|uniref:cell division protein FtsQ/DivIB n=1 Tax=unclassified Myroides TaxID=2642485 RepID=UPI0025787A75|nr:MULTISPECIES: cell division protein FtsQ [unclassified Myroides]MDM1043964.1 cell division protein FtsQ [Myroides sp. R163-1]MDM1054899.1 cell division protein FtsQ [Myroides sp. 1354]MDM1068196.1 cell division protein FtsQ [Myroides sp. 1372]